MVHYIIGLVIGVWSFLGLVIALANCEEVERFHDKISSPLKRKMFFLILGLVGGPLVMAFIICGYIIYYFIEYLAIPSFEFIALKIVAPLQKWLLS